MGMGKTLLPREQKIVFDFVFLFPGLPLRMKKKRSLLALAARSRGVFF
jgi:hypothetical protein